MGRAEKAGGRRFLLPFSWQFITPAECIMVAWSCPLQSGDSTHLQKLKKRYRHLMATIQQRRKLVAAVLLCNGGQGPQGRKAHRQMNFSWAEHVGQLTEEEFRLRYRFTFEGFMSCWTRYVTIS